MPTATKIIVIGSGFAGLSAACVLAAEGYQVQILEKTKSPAEEPGSWKPRVFALIWVLMVLDARCF